MCNYVSATLTSIKTIFNECGKCEPSQTTFHLASMNEKQKRLQHFRVSKWRVAQTAFG